MTGKPAGVRPDTRPAEPSCWPPQWAARLGDARRDLAKLPRITQHLLRSELEIIMMALDDLPLAVDGSEAVRVLRAAFDAIAAEVVVLSARDDG